MTGEGRKERERDLQSLLQPCWEEAVAWHSPGRASSVSHTELRPHTDAHLKSRQVRLHMPLIEIMTCKASLLFPASVDIPILTYYHCNEFPLFKPQTVCKARWVMCLKSSACDVTGLFE